MEKCPTPISGKPSNLVKVLEILGRVVPLMPPSTIAGLLVLTAWGYNHG